MATVAQIPTAELTAVQPEERIATLDILRGFALLGILTINMSGFKSYSAPGEDRFPGGGDQAASWLIDFYGSGKFNSIFSFLFGVGFSIQLGRAAAKGAPFVGTYLRRLAALLAIGVVHGVLIWSGDVLHMYALLGLPLLMLRRVPDRWLLGLAAVLLVAHVGWDGYLLASNTPQRYPPSYLEARGQEQLQVFAFGSYPQMVRDRLKEYREIYWESVDLWFYATLGVTLLLGFVAGRRRIFQNLAAHRGAIRRLMWWCLGLGLVAAFLFATSGALLDHSGRRTFLGFVGTASYEFGRPLLSLFYIAGLSLLSLRPGASRLLSPLRAVGRMPLTNYLMQSVICTSIFYHYGLGYFGRVGPASGLLISLAIYAVQVIYSNIWMSVFRFGPTEWLWRALTYGRRPSMFVSTA